MFTSSRPHLFLFEMKSNGVVLVGPDDVESLICLHAPNSCTEWCCRPRISTPTRRMVATYRYKIPPSCASKLVSLFPRRYDAPIRIHWAPQAKDMAVDPS